jgi:hypothetical protein
MSASDHGSARCYVRWEEVYDWCEEELRAGHDAVTTFLLGQLLEFLELTGSRPSAACAMRTSNSSSRESRSGR